MSDDGPGLPATPSTNGIGLSNTRERLGRLYGADGRVEIINDKGFTVRLVIPLR